MRQVRNHIASDLHDEIGATLSGIGILSKIAKQNLAEKTDSDMQLIKSTDLFDNNEIIMISGKFKMCAGIVKNQVTSLDSN